MAPLKIRELWEWYWVEKYVREVEWVEINSSVLGKELKYVFNLYFARIQSTEREYLLYEWKIIGGGKYEAVTYYTWII